jgi:hypothetical protein
MLNALTKTVFATKTVSLRRNLLGGILLGALGLAVQPASACTNGQLPDGHGGCYYPPFVTPSQAAAENGERLHERFFCRRHPWMNRCRPDTEVIF